MLSTSTPTMHNFKFQLRQMHGHRWCCLFYYAQALHWLGCSFLQPWRTCQLCKPTTKASSRISMLSSSFLFEHMKNWDTKMSYLLKNVEILMSTLNSQHAATKSSEHKLRMRQNGFSFVFHGSWLISSVEKIDAQAILQLHPTCENFVNFQSIKLIWSSEVSLTSMLISCAQLFSIALTRVFVFFSCRSGLRRTGCQVVCVLRLGHGENRRLRLTTCEYDLFKKATNRKRKFQEKTKIFSRAFQFKIVLEMYTHTPLIHTFLSTGHTFWMNVDFKISVTFHSNS